PETRNARIRAHLTRLEDKLGSTQQAISSLRDLLSPLTDAADTIALRDMAPTSAAVIAEVVDAEDSATWLQGALGELYATLSAQGILADGPAGGIFTDEMFTHHRGRATIFVPCIDPVRPVGRVISQVIPAAELAVITHVGAPDSVDRAYGTLATYVARHALAVDGPIREYYLVGQHDTEDTSQWRTEIGWPIFHTGPPARTPTKV
ncbi:MAG TPA: GyrI-like domain-containing protein, partial [Actinopolymorphaceae bacterium]|nr:GyrI-like domain-containing protein [Actinopolymorphaceae bacterium]